LVDKCSDYTNGASPTAKTTVCWFTPAFLFELEAITLTALVLPLQKKRVGV
jgi:hypothetical protein